MIKINFFEKSKNKNEKNYINYLDRLLQSMEPILNEGEFAFYRVEEIEIIPLKILKCFLEKKKTSAS